MHGTGGYALVDTNGEMVTPLLTPLLEPGYGMTSNPSAKMRSVIALISTAPMSQRTLLPSNRNTPR